MTGFLQVVVLGLISAGIYGLFAVGIVLVYRSNRIINFAQASFGGAGAGQDDGMAGALVATFDELLSILSHELRAPLTTIKGSSRTLLRHGARLDGETTRQLLEDIDAELPKADIVVLASGIEDAFAELLKIAVERGNHG